MDRMFVEMDDRGQIDVVSDDLAAVLRERGQSLPPAWRSVLAPVDLDLLQRARIEQTTREQHWLSEGHGPIVGEDWLLRLSRLQGGRCRLDLLDTSIALRAQRRRVRLDSVWDMAAGIAHEFNNRLTAALGNSFRLRSGLSHDATSLSALERLEDALLAMDSLTGRLLRFTSVGGQPPRVMDLSPWLQQQCAFIEARLPANIRIGYQWPTTPLPVQVDGDALAECLLALVENAVDSLHGPGQLQLAMEAVNAEWLRRQQPLWLDIEAERYACIRLRDNGPGISPDLLDRVVEPFVSTRQPGRGLGLSVVLGVLQRHNGGLHLQSARPRGTEAMLYLPLLDEVLAVGAPVTGIGLKRDR
ncbi:MAG: ATP-binding protein [Lysobacterales bacterium]